MNTMIPIYRKHSAISHNVKNTMILYMNVIDPIINGYVYTEMNGGSVQTGGLPISHILHANTQHNGETFVMDKRHLSYSVPSGLVVIENNRSNKISYKYPENPSTCEVISNDLFDKLIDMVSKNNKHSRKTHKQKSKTTANKKTKSLRQTKK